MLSVLTNLIPKPPNDFKGRLAAWWEGEDYVPPDPPSDAPPLAKLPRLAALETIWGKGRLGPSSSKIERQLTSTLTMHKKDYDNADTELDDKTSETTDNDTPDENTGALQQARLGVIGGDAIIAQDLAALTSTHLLIAEWRTMYLERAKMLAPDARIIASDIDRPNFPPEDLKMVISLDAFAFADHKSGFVAKIFRSLESDGHWMALDWNAPKGTHSVPPAFASAWAEVQLPLDNEIATMAESIGFHMAAKPISLSEQVIEATQMAFLNLEEGLEANIQMAQYGDNSFDFLRELAWETESWKWRIRAMEAGLLDVRLWQFRKPKQ